MHSSVFLFLVERGVDLILEEAKPEPWLWVLVIFANVCGAYLVGSGYVHFLLSIVKYYEQMGDPMRGEICQCKVEEALAG